MPYIHDPIIKNLTQLGRNILKRMEIKFMEVKRLISTTTSQGISIKKVNNG
jgi:hypothetical protein